MLSTDRALKISPALVHFARLCVYLLYSLEAGIVLVLLPWTDLWTHNQLFMTANMIETVLMSPLTRGLVSGIGMALVLNALLDILQILWSSSDGLSERP